MGHNKLILETKDNKNLALELQGRGLWQLQYESASDSFKGKE